MTRVLVVDDDAGIRSIVAELLEDEGCTVGTAGDGLKHSNAPRKAPPAAILLDLMMPVLDAWGLSRRAGSEAFAWVYR
jgi:CheY-like chemotaxis protein